METCSSVFTRAIWLRILLKVLSNDVPFGLPFNIMGYSLLNIFFSKVAKYEPGELVYFGADVHIYNNQMELVKEQLQREPYPLPKLKIHKELNTFDDILSLEFSDIELIDYQTHGFTKNRPPMAV